MIKAKVKGFYFFDWEIELLKEIGFKFPRLKEVNKIKRYIRMRIKKIRAMSREYQILENPKPINSTQKRKELLLELPYKMNAINVTVNDVDARSIHFP